MVRDRNRKSRHFPPPASIAGQVWASKEWEKWEEELICSLRAQGKTYGQISRRLPGRTESACRSRAAGKLRTQTMPHSKKTWKAWKDWEDQIVIGYRKAGASYRTISKSLSHRTASAVEKRWNNLLKSRTEVTIATPTAKRYPHRWTEREDQLLKSLRESGQNWTEIAKEFPGCTTTQCRSHWYDIVPPQSARGWNEWEEWLLISGYYAGLSWKEIAKSIPEHTTSAVSCHWTEYFCLPRHDGPWTSEELTLLTHLRAEGSSWDNISQKIPGHSSKACRTQWYKETEGLQGCSHRESNGSWSAEETDTLIALYNTIGPRWEEISKHLHGRTARGCRDRLRKRCTKEDGVGDAPSKYWIDYFDSKSHTRTVIPAPISELTR